MQVGIKNLKALGLVSALLLLSSCGLLRDEPTNKAVKLIESFATMAEAEYSLQRKSIAVRERLAFDYLRALQAQNRKLSYGVENVQRINAGSRTVLVTVSERDTASSQPERARFKVLVNRDDQNVWRIESYRLVE